MDGVMRRRISSRCVVRVAAGPRVGYGHLMRVRALAYSLEMPTAVSVRGGSAASRVAGTMGLRLVRDSDAIDRAALLIVDDPSLRHGRSWIARARRLGVPSVSIHDHAPANDADLVVCGSLGIGRIRSTGSVLNGVQFYLLDRRLAAARRARSRHSNDRSFAVLVALGGGQHVRRLAQRVVDAIRRRCPDASIAVAAGFSRGRRPTLRGAQWLSARTGLASALGACDVAVVAGGVTLYEACALGTPAVGLAVVPGQRRAIRACARHGAVIDTDGVGASALESAADGVAALLTNRRLRLTTAARARRLVDGLGSDRVAEQIRGLLGQGVRRVA
jgi:spore coat polysaccharide biosynthesis predicted glycosyltransferase SpsG